MPFVGGLLVFIGSVLEIAGLIHSKQYRNVFKQMSLVLFDTQNIVGLSLDDGFGDVGLGSHGINRDDTA